MDGKIDMETAQILKKKCSFIFTNFPLTNITLQRPCICSYLIFNNYWISAFSATK